MSGNTHLIENTKNTNWEKIAKYSQGAIGITAIITSLALIVLTGLALFGGLISAVVTGNSIGLWVMIGGGGCIIGAIIPVPCGVFLLRNFL